MNATPPVVIAHRGASAYLPEHSQAAKVLAHALGADFIEQDVILTQDDIPIVFHDLELNALTDVALRFPDRARPDGSWYAIDFTLAELRTLSIRERIDPASGRRTYPGRYAGTGVPFPIVTLDEELALVRALNRVRGRDAGVYTEVKSPAWHRAQGKDPSPIVIETLARHGYAGRGDNAYLQCFDDVELRRIRQSLGCDLKLVQLIGENAWAEAATDYDRLRTAEGLAAIAGYADGIGPPMTRIVGFDGAGEPVLVSSLCADAQGHGLAVHPFTFRADALPPGARDSDAVHEGLFGLARVDGLFTDFCDLTRAFIDHRHPRRSRA